MRYIIGRQTRLPWNWRRRMADGDLLTIVAGHQAFAAAASVVDVPVLARTTVLTNAQIKALPTTGIELVPAPAGPRQVINPIVAYLNAYPVSNAYTNIDPAGFMTIGWGAAPFQATDLTQGMYMPNDAGAGLAELDAILVGLPKGVLPYHLINGSWGPYGLRQGDLNEALAIGLENNGAGDLTGGNDATTMRVTVVYVVIDL